MAGVQVVPYNSEWPEWFQEEALKIKQALGENCVEIHHVGSTSVPELSAKPIIDIIPVVKNILKVNSSELEALGYKNRGELGMVFRRFFMKIEPVRSYHVHIWEEHHPEIELNLLFSRHLRENLETKEAYERLKLKLASEYKEDRNSYTKNKDPFIRNVLQKAGFQGYHLVHALTEYEWRRYHDLRKTYLFDPIGVLYDHAHPTLTAPNHFHFVFSKGMEIIGAAHIEFLEGQRAALRALVIEKNHQRQGHGQHLLALMERWSQHSGKDTIHLHARLEAEAFYRHAGYTDMFFDDIPLTSQSLPLGKFIEKI